MIRLLTEADRTKVLDYLYKEVSYNIFPIGDIEAFGFETDFQRVYGEFDKDNEYLSIFLRYREHGIYYSHLTHFNRDYLDIFKSDSFEYISGKSNLMQLIKPTLINFKCSSMYFCRATQIKKSITYDSSVIKEIDSKADCELLYDLLVTIPEFGVFNKTKEKFVEGKLISKKMSKTLFIEENQKIVSTVATTAETTKNAMVVAVATEKKYRGRGYASKLLSALMKYYIIDLKKELCLFYDNPKAGKIYLDLGFENIGTWEMCSLIQKN
ncbi:MAG: GNAT family N-acetyltransferase [Tenericutes bacterium]|nr:GNAT family N-acetyltransferase [Mycoplasmatota bacterium]